MRQEIFRAENVKWGRLQDEMLLFHRFVKIRLRTMLSYLPATVHPPFSAQTTLRGIGSQSPTCVKHVYVIVRFKTNNIVEYYLVVCSE